MGEFETRTAELIEAGRHLHQRNMAPATSGNLSARLSDGTLAVTVSGKHKGKLSDNDILRCDPEGRSLDGRKPSAETLLHVQIYRRFPEARIVLHPHSISATLISRMSGDYLSLQDYELLKAFAGVVTHNCAIRVPVFDNDQNIPRLAEVVDRRLATLDPVYGYLIRGHGFYTWGADLEEALRHVEAFEFLFECELRLRSLK